MAFASLKWKAVAPGAFVDGRIIPNGDAEPGFKVVRKRQA